MLLRLITIKIGQVFDLVLDYVELVVHEGFVVAEFLLNCQLTVHALLLAKVVSFKLDLNFLHFVH